MIFTDRHWGELFQDGYTVVRSAVDAPHLVAAQDAASHLNAVHPDGGWERSKNELWREIRDSDHPAFVALANDVLDPLALEILDSVTSPDRLQLASTLPGFSTAGIVGRHFHIDGGRAPSLAVFNVLLGVALTAIESDSAGGFHVLPGSHHRFAELFGDQPTDTAIDWGEVKRSGQKLFLSGAMVVPRLMPGDVIVAHCFLAHGTSANTTSARRDMIFQRRAARPLADPATQLQARETFMRDPWAFFRRRR
ncbi:Phytanoyl-CoA dioxygenase (PhyH) [Enhydrobacter aerosaccus]|uniref:Phytanoyl-CoA dioxygenase (PhyH) n=1 Tax=Enhydrobacter aerosaccus TaxID=225324 RepID=A0A1T4JUT7_9HYPH|nr:phytanoyl-CoA dioxygenase family protein [Enhydrobacter aerosaccus]SJZ33903.1 Phytanoyl-CoA dioxygenase (PhyH) [Enhydrobacter aerosaccus]